MNTIFYGHASCTAYAVAPTKTELPAARTGDSSLLAPGRHPRSLEQVMMMVMALLYVYLREHHCCLTPLKAPSITYTTLQVRSSWRASLPLAVGRPLRHPHIIDVVVRWEDRLGVGAPRPAATDLATGDTVVSTKSGSHDSKITM